jgi:ATP-dependent DNA helicase PIF1
MFLTGPAGAGKNTATKVARRFCFEFSLAVGALWSDRTFLFTVYTGSAAMLVGGLTICKAGFLMKKGALTEEDKREWQEVRILIIDEISFMCDDELKKLDQRLKEVRDRAKPFGGVLIVFAGDFRQLEPSASSENNLLLSRQSSNLWNDSINVIIILNNEHRCKDDPRYG